MRTATSLVSLAQLATDTGGRYTERVNDLTLAYARAQRDAGCVYTLGVYVPEDQEDVVRDLAVRVARRGLHAIHPSKYVFRSPEKKRVSRLQAAWIAPDLYETGVVRAQAFPLRPLGKKAWEALLSVSFAIPLGERSGESAQRVFGAVLSDGSRVAHRFTRIVTLEPDRPDVDSTPTVTFVEPVKLKPGPYTLTAVLSDPEQEDPHATRVEITVPDVPRKELFLVEPILGRPAGADVVIRGTSNPTDDEIGDEGSFQPLLVAQLDRPEDLLALTQVCHVGKRKRAPKVSGAIERVLLEARAGAVGKLEPVEIGFEEEGSIRCQNLLDVFPGSSMRNGEYVYEARLASESDDGCEPRTLRFAVGPASLLPEGAEVGWGR